MFDIGWQELFILAVIALIVIGPKDLPGAIRTITRGLRKARAMARDLREGIDEVVQKAELEDLTNTGEDLTQQIKDAADLDLDDMDLEGDLREEMIGATEDLKALTNLGASDTSDKEVKAEMPAAPKKREPGKRKASKSGKADG